MCGPLAAFSTSSAPCVIRYVYSPSSFCLWTLSQCQRMAFVFIFKSHLQFQAPSWKSLILKICRGAYPPLPAHLPYELQFLVKQMFKINPKDRPSVHTILTSHRASRLLRARLPAQVKPHRFFQACWASFGFVVTLADICTLSPHFSAHANCFLRWVTGGLGHGYTASTVSRRINAKKDCFI